VCGQRVVFLIRGGHSELQNDAAMKNGKEIKSVIGRGQN